jgi:hypothetical protein
MVFHRAQLRNGKGLHLPARFVQPSCRKVATISKCVDELAALDMTRKGHRNNGRFAVKWHSRNRLVRGGVNAWIATS